MLNYSFYGITILRFKLKFIRHTDSDIGFSRFFALETL